ncbi:MAG: hypothetical protein HZA90_27030 [Verrucomicrobia bacterium]|nr:hypothetical protein [Verrucomicrobiota bacterium]
MQLADACLVRVSELKRDLWRQQIRTTKEVLAGARPNGYEEATPTQKENSVK